MNRLNRLVRQYHRKIALVLALPLLLTVLTGMAYTILVEWFQQGAIAPTILSLHNGEIFRLGGIYPILNGLGLLGLLATGLPMTSLFSKRRTQKEASDR
ncbi:MULTISPECIES: peptidase [Trichocoleus]|uniref:Peptidase n=1 Tax=Trichocoleus desertorum GB2-A4 TaxID=2933944 RepID=A0ABV0J7T9_9CYAN|nr:peptidase [Trichocoleus sp. FACHB-46]MBD1862185.1 peptidase [Trichocoleus sp. FACHB-46]